MRLEQYLHRWIVLSSVEKNFKSLYDFMIRDQILTNCPHDLRVFLKEREFQTSLELAEAADRFWSAHDFTKKSKPKSQVSGNKNKSESENSAGSSVTCHECGESGHIRPKCPKNPRNFKQTSEQPKKVQFVFETDLKPENSLVDLNSKIFNNCAEVVLDTGCNTVLVNEKLVPSKFMSGSVQEVYDFLGVKRQLPVARCHITSKFHTGWVRAIVAPLKFADVLVGLIPGAKVPESEVGVSETVVKVSSKIDDKIMNVQTHLSKKRNLDKVPLSCPKFSSLDVGKDDFKNDQKQCPTLSNVRLKVDEGKEIKVRNRVIKFEATDGLIYRVCIQSKVKTDVGCKQLVVPEKHRMKVLNLAHDSIFSGHFSHRKTEDKVFRMFYWPGAGSDIVCHCRSCVVCQKVSPKGKVSKVPMKQIPVISEPFSRVAIDLVGPIIPASDRGHRYVLTLIDYATRFPEAVPLKSIDTLTIAKCLVEIFSRVGVPREILSNNGQQFKSDLMSEINRLLNIKAIFTSPYHACTNGVVERLNGTLKSMIKKLCGDHPNDWDRFIPAALFTYREIPIDSLKFSPFKLLYGRNVRGPLNILHELWTNDSIDYDKKTTYQYVLDLRSRLEETAKIAAKNAATSSARYKEYYDLKTKPRKLKVREKILLLLHTKANK